MRPHVPGENPAIRTGLIVLKDRFRLFEVIETGVPFDNQVALEPVPDLFQLARLVVEQETAVVALVDTNTTRLL
jgi:hypothetical protein